MSNCLCVEAINCETQGTEIFLCRPCADFSSGIRMFCMMNEKRIDVEISPLLVEIVKYANLIESSLEVTKTGSGKQKEPTFAGSVPSGGPKGRELEVPVGLWELLKGSSFPNLMLS